MPRFERKITLQEAEDIKEKMIAHHRLDGFIYINPNNTLSFLTSKPSEGGSLITLQDVQFIIQARKIEIEH